jgi:hypothetical protein
MVLNSIRPETRSFSMGWLGSQVVRRNLVVSVSIVLMHASLIAAQAPARAAVADCGSPDFQFKAYIYDGPNYELGAQSDIEIRDATTCSTSGHPTYVASWSMLAESGGFGGYAQIGYVVTLGSPRRYLWQWSKDGSAPIYTAKWGTPPLQSTVSFTASRYPSDGHIHLYYAIGTTPPDNQLGNHPETNFDPLNAWADSATEFASETQDRQNDLPGGAQDHQGFTSVQEKNINEVWGSQTFNATDSTNLCYFNKAKYSDSHFGVWTDPQDHQC